MAPPALFASLAKNPEWAKFWSAAAQPYATFLVGIGAIIAASLAFYNGERERRQRGVHESDKAKRETKRELTERQSQLVAELSNATPIIREAAAHGLVALAEDWLAFGDDNQHRVCVSMLATYLRTPMTDPGPQCPDVPVRGTIIRLISELVERRGIKHYWRELNLRSVDLQYVSLVGLKMEEVWFDSANLTGADLSGADFTRSNFGQATLSECDMTATNFTGAMLQLATARHANLRRTNFTKGALFGANFGRSYIIRERTEDDQKYYRSEDFISQAPLFNDAYLMGAMFADADLSGVTFQGARLEFADFTKARLYCANLAGAILKATNVESANLTGATLVDSKIGPLTLIFNDDTRWPEGFEPPPAFTRMAVN
ncbi:pentapeptide repeat-containing protein [Mycolicibacterium sp.]|uniref:pentapeptide repeat-containing protein n=2 Tax=Mycolicibacterium sp. TaxID=2320850 RepID=UPI0037CA68E0